MDSFDFRPAWARATLIGGGDPAILPEHAAGIHLEPEQCVATLFRGLRQDPGDTDGAADARHAELQHVHLVEVEEQEAAAVPRGDLGRGGRVDSGRAAAHRRGALARAPPAGRARVAARPGPARSGPARLTGLHPPARPAARLTSTARPSGENAHRLASFSEVHGH